MWEKDYQKQHGIILSELEMCGLAINIAICFHVLRTVDFDAIVDHLAFTYTSKVKQNLWQLE